MSDLTPKFETDASKEALRAVEKLTGSEAVTGEDLLGSEELRRKLREAKAQLKQQGSKDR